jgi:guanosine-3',5'-bis(diphosphate) 3'-pyrophosphohydrolase
MMRKEKEMDFLMSEVVAYAACIHREQRRQDAAATPYFNHLAEVAELVERAGGNKAAVAAAYLHDSDEDQKVGISNLRMRFGYEVAYIVHEVTDNQEDVYNRLLRERGEQYASEVVNNPKLLTREFKVQQAIDIPRKSHGGKLVKVSDCISNTRSLVASKPKWSLSGILGYADAKKAVVDAVRGFNAYLEVEFDAAYAEVQRVYG